MICMQISFSFETFFSKSILGFSQTTAWSASKLRGIFFWQICIIYYIYIIYISFVENALFQSNPKMEEALELLCFMFLSILSFHSRFEPDNGLIGFQDAWGKCWNYTWVGALCDNTDCVKDISGFLCFDWKEEYFTVRPQTSHSLNQNVFIMFEVHHNHNNHHGHHHRVPNS